MAFISIKDISHRAKNWTPKITIRHGSCNIATCIHRGADSVTVQIDQENKAIRVKAGHGLDYKLGGSSFALPIAASREILGESLDRLPVALTKNEDGWWYGSYATTNNQEE